MLNVEYLIHKVACALSRDADDLTIRFLLLQDNLSEEEIYLIICAGKILFNDWEIDDEPTKPGIRRNIK